MGEIFSTPAPRPAPRPTPQPRTMMEEPWRRIKGWNKSVREELRDHVASLKPITNDETKVPFFNIVLTGQIKSGKSSFFNSINSLFTNRIIASKADTGVAAKSLTKEFRIYEVKPRPDAAPMPWRIIDTMGLDTQTGETDVKNLLKAVDGHVPDKYRFTSGTEFHHRCPGFVANPTLAQQAHCVAIVVDASQARLMEEQMWQQLRSLRQGLISKNIPTYVILTHIGEACNEVQKDVKNAHHSIKIDDIVSYVRKRLTGITENQIFPVENYSKELDLEDEMDILLLYALRQMLYSAQEHMLDKKNECRLQVK